MNQGTLCAASALFCLFSTAAPADVDPPGPPRGAGTATLAGGTAARSAEGASTARGGSPRHPTTSAGTRGVPL